MSNSQHLQALTFPPFSDSVSYFDLISKYNYFPGLTSTKTISLYFFFQQLEIVQYLSLHVSMRDF